MLPNLIIPGAPKAGTTSLANYLNYSPEVFFRNGESKYFYDDKKYKRGIRYYESLFESPSTEKIIGEVSNIYLYSEKALSRIKYVLPEVKFIICLRDPVKRAFSQYNAAREKGTEVLSFKAALKQEKLRRKLPHRFFKNNYAYQFRGYYSVFIERMFRYFDKNQFYFYILEKLHSNPIDELSKVTEFLNIDNQFIRNVDFNKVGNKTRYPRFPLLQFPITLIKKQTENNISSKFLKSSIQKIETFNFKKSIPKLSQELYNELKKEFRNDIEKLEILIGEDLSNWK